jgi:hypothetical protein
MLEPSQSIREKPVPPAPNGGDTDVDISPGVFPSVSAEDLAAQENASQIRNSARISQNHYRN